MMMMLKAPTCDNVEAVKDGKNLKAFIIQVLNLVIES